MRLGEISRKDGISEGKYSISKVYDAVSACKWIYETRQASPFQVTFYNIFDMSKYGSEEGPEAKFPPEISEEDFCQVAKDGRVDVVSVFGVFKDAKVIVVADTDTTEISISLQTASEELLPELEQLLGVTGVKRDLHLDFIKLEDILYSVDGFNMGLRYIHWCLAYVLDALYHADFYDEEYLTLRRIAKNDDCNEFSWRMLRWERKIMNLDRRISTEGKKAIEAKCVQGEALYKEGNLREFDGLPKECAPKWFSAVYEPYHAINELKDRNAIFKTCVNENGMSNAEANKICDELEKIELLKCEYAFYARNGRMAQKYPLAVCDYSAKEIVDKTGLSPLGAYLYMIYLLEMQKLDEKNNNKDASQKAIQDLENGLKLKSKYEWESSSVAEQE